MPDPRYLPPEPGMPRQVLDATGAVAGIEVWTGLAWLPLAYVAMVSTAEPPRSPVLTMATVVLGRVLPPVARVDAA